jgi:formate dehydrogenase iron-sulfur subunit
VSLGYGDDARPRMAFFTDTTVCIGCKACEVACKEWNDVPAAGSGLTGFSYDNTAGLGSDHWRAVKFVEQGPGDLDLTRAGPDGVVASLDEPPSPDPAMPGIDFRWLMASDVCKHCTTAACLDVCPTGAMFKTEFSTVVIQPDVCNGCGYCVPACPYGVVDRRDGDGRAWKCTMCYDRLKGGLEPACAQTCPTDSIMFGTYEAMQAVAAERLGEVVAAGVPGAQLYGEDPGNGVDGCGAFFLLLDEPEVYGLPPDPVATTKDLPSMWRAAGVAAVGLVAGVTAAVVAGTRLGDRRGG